MPSLTGDFDGDGLPDTLIQQLRLETDGSSVDSVPDVCQEDYDSTVKYYLGKNTMSTVVLSSKDVDTIQLDDAMGTYCLINLGDNNKDGKDEIALVPDLLDYSNLNTCHIYSLCGRHWITLKTLDTNEDAFTFTQDTIFNSIPEYLEKRNGTWMYRDSTYVFRLLELPACGKN